MTDNTHNDLTLEELSARREKLGLSVADMANRIKVSREIIHFIEQGEFNRIGSATFIRGHVGNYARELGLDPQMLLDLVPPQHLKPYEPKLSSSKVSNPLSRVKTHSSGFGRYVLGTFLVAALGLSFYFVYDKWDSKQSDPILQIANDRSDVPVDDNPQKKKVIYSSLLPQADLAGEDSTPPANEQIINAGNGSETMTENFDGNQQTTVPSDEGSDNDSLDNLNAQSQPQESNNRTMSEQARYSIQFDISEQAWVSIKTESGETVVSDLIGPGKRQYNADESLHFRIGNAGQLSLHINEQAIDLSNHTRQNVADFNWPPKDGSMTIDNSEQR
jgi:cytoskeleton protein RodZ